MSFTMKTRYLGHELASPVMPSASPLTGDIDHVHALVEAGAPALVLPSLFEEQIDHDAMAVHLGLELGAGSFGEAPTGYLPVLDEYNTGPSEYLDLITRIKEETAVPVFASLNGTSVGGWTHYARILADQGVDGLELNIYKVAADVTQTSSEVEADYLRLVEQVRSAVSLPLSVKIGPFFSSVGDVARGLVGAGADGLVLFNRFYQPDFDLETLDVRPNLVLSTPGELRLVLRWLAILYGKVECDMAATTGIHGYEDAIKAILAGATVATMASALLKHGPTRLSAVIDGVSGWFEERGYDSIDQARGSLSHQAVPDPEAFERANYMKTLTSYVPYW